MKKDLVRQGFRGQAVVCSVLLRCGREHVRHQCHLPQRQLGLLHAQDPRKKKMKKSIRKPHEIRAAKAALQ